MHSRVGVEDARATSVHPGGLDTSTQAATQEGTGSARMRYHPLVREMADLRK